ncbi:MAG: glutamate synthase [Defluviitaleaceae bacterium]|nr:glutamate synthase [Defluviitaleaceae bacterium]MCL2263914.1 glutamate synthase [Defluviitaleaceae bacterium]
MTITAGNMHFQELNEKVKSATGDVCVDECFGQRFIASGASGRTITINGTPGNALGAYLDGAEIQVNGNVQDAVGDTMNDGKIIVHGNAGDALGYAMRGGKIFVKGDAGYRTGIHMKEYNEKKPIIVIGGSVGSFLGEYLAGGVIIVLGLDADSIPVGHFTGTGMHGGRIYIRTNAVLDELPSQVIAEEATPEELEEIAEYTSEFAAHFKMDGANFANDRFLLLKPNAKNPYKQLYTEN